MELIVEGINIPALSDDELATRLRNLGFPVGPIVDTTRRVYQLKLARLLRNEDTTASDSEDAEEKLISPNSIASSHLQSDTVGDSPSVGFHNYVASTSFDRSSILFDRSPTSPFRYDELRRKPLPRVGTSLTSTPSTFRSPLTVDGHSKLSVPPSKSAATKPSPFSTGVKIAILACVLLFAILVYRNMESSATNPVPEFSVP